MRHKLFFLLCVFAGHGIHAQTDRVIKEILIEANAEKDAVQQQKESNTATLVVSSKDLNNLGHHAAGDVLKRLPRIVVQGPPSFNRNIMMAGLDKEFQSILINGNRPAGGEDSRDLKLDRIPMDMIEKIEVVYNPPAFMGADATIGLVNVVLKDAPDEELFSADLSLDNTSTKTGFNPEGALTYGNKWGKWSFIGSYSLNSFQRININNLEDTIYSGQEQEDLNVVINGFTGTVAFQPDSTQVWKYQSFFSHYHEVVDFEADVKRRSKGGLNIAADTADDEKLRVLHTHTLSYKKKYSNGEWRTSLNFAQHFDDKDRWRKREKSSGLEVSYEDEYQVNSEAMFLSGYSAKNQWGSVLHHWKAGVKASWLDRDYDRIAYTKIDGRLFWDIIEDGSYELNEYRAGAYVADEFRLGDLWVSPSARIDFDKAEYLTAQEEGGQEYFSFNPSLHLKYQLSDDLFLKSDLARQISRPPFNLMVPIDKVKNKKELIERGNPDLQPSRAWNIGLGAEKYFAQKSYIAWRGFYAIMREVIETRELGIDEVYGYRIFQSVNVDSGHVWGMDVSARIDFNRTIKGLSFWGNLSWLGSEVRDPGTGELRRLNEQPQWITNGTLDYLNTRYKFQCSLGINYIGERVTASTIDEGAVVEQLVQSPFMQWDARIKYFFSDWGSVYLNAINIFNETVDYTQGAVTESEIIGRNIVLGVSLRF